MVGITLKDILTSIEQLRAKVMQFECSVRADEAAQFTGQMVGLLVEAGKNNKVNVSDADLLKQIYDRFLEWAWASPSAHCPFCGGIEQHIPLCPMAILQLRFDNEENKEESRSSSNNPILR
jgi:hypothetical protein